MILVPGGAVDCGAVAEVRAYLDAEMLQLQYALVLSRTTSDVEFTFSNGVRLCSLSDLGRSPATDTLTRLASLGPISPGDVLVAEYTVEKGHYPNTESGPGLEYARWPPWQDLEDTQLLVSLARSSQDGIARLVSTTLVPEELMFLDRSVAWALSAQPAVQIDPPLLAIELKRADALLHKFNEFDEDTQDRLRIALRRLNDSKIDPDYVNKAINLRICIENMFVDDWKAIARQVQVRMPTLTSFSKSRSRKVYRFLSGPVHSGRPPDHETLTVNEVQAEVVKAVVKILENGCYPNWQTFQTPRLRSRIRPAWRVLTGQ